MMLSCVTLQGVSTENFLGYTYTYVHTYTIVRVCITIVLLGWFF